MTNGARQPLDAQGRPDWTGTLNWGAGAAERGAGLMSGTRPCVLCGGPAITISPSGESCHKVCAEQRLRDHPKPAARSDDTL